jgi:hypothetical protein
MELVVTHFKALLSDLLGDFEDEENRVTCCG